MGQLFAYSHDDASTGKTLESPLLPNPLNASIVRTARLFEKLPLNGLNVIPSMITAVIFAIVLALQMVFWPLGWAPVIAELLNRFIQDARREMGKAETYPEKMPYVMSAGILGAMWLLFTLVCVPFYIGGVVAELFAARKPTAASTP